MRELRRLEGLMAQVYASGHAQQVSCLEVPARGERGSQQQAKGTWRESVRGGGCYARVDETGEGTVSTYQGVWHRPELSLWAVCAIH